MQDVLVVAIVFAVPITAIVSWARIKMKRIEVESGVASRDLADRLARLERDNVALQERVGTLETIVTLDDRPRTAVRIDAGSQPLREGVEREADALRAQAQRTR